MFELAKDIARPASLMLCILSLFASFRAAFLIPTTDLRTKIHDSFALLLFSAGVSILGGLLFREATPGRRRSTLLGTLPMQLFLWASTIIVVMFACSWYLETYYLPWNNLR
ncbi:MAG TPA: hypothetical protein VGC07_04915 [Granulicella sp.]